MTEKMVSVEVKLPAIVAELLAVLDRDVAHSPRQPEAPLAPDQLNDMLAADRLQLTNMLVPELLRIAEQLEIDDAQKLGKQDLIDKILDKHPRTVFPATKAPVAETLEQRCARVLMQLADHAKQGVYQNGGWERQWVVQAFGDGWLERTEPGDPYDRGNDQLDRELSQRLYRRPKPG